MIAIGLHRCRRRSINVRQHHQRIRGDAFRFGIAIPVHLAHKSDQFGQNQLAVRVLDVVDQAAQIHIVC